MKIESKVKFIDRNEPISRAKIGQTVPTRTSMGNIIYTKIVAPWSFANSKYQTFGNWLYDERAILWFIDELDFRFENDLKTHILGTGDLGSGKSTASMVRYRLYKFKCNWPDVYQAMIREPGYVDMIEDMLEMQPLDINDCCFKLEELKNKCFNNKATKDPSHPRRKYYNRSYYIMDESGKELSSHRWQDRYVEDMKQQLDISRVKREIIDMNLPHLRGIIKGIRDNNADFLSHTFAEKKNGKLQRGVMEIREASKDRWEQEIFWTGTLACMFPKLDDKSYWDYFDKKVEYVEANDCSNEQSTNFNLWLGEGYHNLMKNEDVSLRAIERSFHTHHKTIAERVDEYVKSLPSQIPVAEIKNQADT